jgi:hypothetical protein
LIASWIMKRMVRSMSDKAWQGDAESTFGNMADDGIYDFPLEISVGGTIKGKKAIMSSIANGMSSSPRGKLLSRISPLQLGRRARQTSTYWNGLAKRPIKRAKSLNMTVLLL